MCCFLYCPPDSLPVRSRWLTSALHVNTPKNSWMTGYTSSKLRQVRTAMHALIGVLNWVTLRAKKTRYVHPLAMTLTIVFHATSQIMLNAHVDTMVLLATPFRPSTPQPFAFGPGSRWANITGQIRARIPIMLQHRLTPPPRETYSLNRSVGHDLARCISIILITCQGN